MKSEIKVGVIFSYITLIIGNLISFIYTPYMVKCLGQSQYGLVSFVNSILAYISLMDAGVGSAIIRYNSMYIQNKDKSRQEKINGMFLKFYGVLGIIILAVGMIFTINLQNIFNKYTLEEISIAKILMTLSTINLAISFPLNIFSSVIISYEKFTFQKGVALAKTLITPCVNVILLINGGKSIALTAFSLLITLFVGVLNIRYCRKKLKFKFSFEKVEKKVLKSIFKYSFFILLSMIAYQVYWNTDQFIIGKLMGAAPIAIYAMGMNFNNYFRTFSDFASGMFLPRLTKMVEAGNEKNIMDELIKVSKMQLFICGLIFTGFILIGKQFIVLWVGDTYIESYIIALIVMIPQTISIIQSLFATLLQSMNKHNIKAYIYLGMSFVNVIFTLLLVGKYGMIGCALGTAIGMTLNAILNNIYYSAVLKLKMGRYWLNLSRPIIGIAIYAYVVFILIGLLNVSIASYLHILSFALIYTIGYCLTFYIFSNKNERNKILHNILKKK